MLLVQIQAMTILTTLLVTHMRKSNNVKMLPVQIQAMTILTTLTTMRMRMVGLELLFTERDAPFTLDGSSAFCGTCLFREVFLQSSKTSPS
jgi:hypothetical protein